MSIEPEFSRTVSVDGIGGAATAHAIEAGVDERAALAKRFGLIAIEGLAANAEIRREDSVICATGTISASVVQNCVVTGDPVAGTIETDFELRFVPESAPPTEEEIELSADECETLTYSGGAIDLGEAAAQTMALALDPFPRSPNAEAALDEAGVISEEEAGPFGALKELRDALKAKD